jgi:predicted nuclease of predicted toxin-antitoxin system
MKKYKWRLYADHNIEKELVYDLRSSGFNVLWVIEDKYLEQQKDDSFHYQMARKLRRYLLTKDNDFWDDHIYPIQNSPGVIILATTDVSVSKYLPVILRNLMRDYNPDIESVYLYGIKIKIGAEELIIKMIDSDTQKISTEKWNLKDLI